MFEKLLELQKNSYKRDLLARRQVLLNCPQCPLQVGIHR